MIPTKCWVLPHGVTKLPLHAVFVSVHAQVAPACSSEQVVSLLLAVVSKLQLVGGFVVTQALGREERPAILSNEGRSITAENLFQCVLSLFFCPC